MKIKKESDLRYAPTLKRLLISFVNRSNKENPDISDKALLKEYIALKLKHRLHKLFEEEASINKNREDAGFAIEETLINPKVNFVLNVNHLDSTDDEEFFDDENDSENYLPEPDDEPDDDFVEEAKEETPIPDSKPVKILLIPMQPEPDDEQDDE
jgi:hypothetical protein